MIDIKWAKENSNVDLARQRRIAEAMATYEDIVDTKIKEACDCGKKYCDVDDFGCSPLDAEALAKVMAKYIEAGYSVEPFAYRNGEAFAYIIKW